MENNYIMMGDKKVSVRSCSYSSMFGYLNIEVIGLSFLDATEMFLDNDNTKNIQYYYNGELDKEYNGFTLLIMVKLLVESNNLLITLSRDFSI